MNKVLKDLPFAIAYLDVIIIYSKFAEDHLDHVQVFSQSLQCKTIYEIEQVSLLHQENSIFGSCPQHNWYKTTTLQNVSH